MVGLGRKARRVMTTHQPRSSGRSCCVEARYARVDVIPREPCFSSLTQTGLVVWIELSKVMGVRCAFRDANEQVSN